MKKSGWIGLLIALLLTAWVLAISCDARAQKEKKSGKKDRESKKTEEQIQKEKVKVEKGAEIEEAEDREGTEKRKKKEADRNKKQTKERTEKAKKFKYRPKALKDEEMREWEDGIPPGWTRGKKTGWGEGGAPPGKMKKEGGRLPIIKRLYPPGSEEWDPEKKKAWDRRLEDAKERIRKRTRTRDEMAEEDVESAVRSIEETSREGVPIERAEATVDKAIDRGMTGREIEQVTRAVAYGADKDIDYDELNAFVDTKMEEGQEGDELAVSIYEEIDRRHVEQQQKEEAKKKPWWKRIFKRS